MKAAFLAAAAMVVLAAQPAQPASADQPPLPALPHSVEITLKAQRDGSLLVAEAVSVPQGATMTRRVPLRVAAAHNRDRVFGVRDVSIEGAGSSELQDDTFTIKLGGGTSIVRYTVDGAVSAADGVEHVTWQLADGWDTELELLRASFAAPHVPNAVSCVAGPDGSDGRCLAAQIDHSGLTRFSQAKLPAGQRMTMTVELPEDTVPANERLEPSKTVGGAFVLTPPVVWAWAGFGALLLVAAALAWWLRRRDRDPGDPAGTELVSPQGAFASPEGVLPGHAGTVLDGRAGPLDLAATVLDLAVRNYLWVTAEDDGADWRLTRRNPADEHLTAFERAVFEAVLPGDTESVTLAEVRRGHVDVGRVEEVLYGEVVDRGWFSRSPDKRLGRLGRAGTRVIFYGVFVTVLLMLTIGYAQLGLIVSFAGAAAAALSAALPARRGHGRELARRLRGLAVKLGSVRLKSVPAEQRELVFSRGLPYALALGEQASWVSAFAAYKQPPAVYWHGGEVTPEQAGAFAAVLAGTFAGARRARVLDEARLTS